MDVSSYTNEYIGLFIENEDKITILISHLINGYEGFSLISDYLSQFKCKIKTKLKFIENKTNKINDKIILSFLRTLSIFSCFYNIYPGSLTIIYMLTYYLIYIYISILILNEKNDLRNLMKIFGLHPIIYWTSMYIYHLIIILFYTFIIYFIYSFNNYFENNINLIKIINENNLIIKSKLFIYLFILSSTILPFIYLLIKLVKNEIICSLLIFIILILIELIDLINELIKITLKEINSNKLIYWLINILIPPINSKHLILILLKNSNKNLCYLIKKDKNFLSKINLLNELNENNLFKYIFINIFHILILFLILCLIDFNFNFNLNEDINILSNKTFICYNLIKKYSNSNKLIINHLNFSLEQGECFGLLGFNGSGKTTLFKIIIGEEKSTNGFILINGNKFNGINKHIGYCPQINLSIQNLTLENYLYLFAHLKSISNLNIKHKINIISKVFSIDLYLKQYIHQLSYGTIRRMHTAIACLAKPNLILLDEPTTGVDPYNRSKMIKIFEYALNNKITILLTTHSMDECEMLCSRIGIMSYGKFKAFGFIQDIKNNYENGYSIYIKINSINYKLIFSNLFIYLNKFIQIKIHYQTKSTIIFQTNSLSPTKLFYLIENIKDEFFIETYQIQQITLEQIFLQL